MAKLTPTLDPADLHEPGWILRFLGAEAFAPESMYTRSGPVLRGREGTEAEGFTITFDSRYWVSRVDVVEGKVTIHAAIRWDEDA